MINFLQNAKNTLTSFGDKNRLIHYGLTHPTVPQSEWPRTVEELHNIETYGKRNPDFSGNPVITDAEALRARGVMSKQLAAKKRVARNSVSNSNEYWVRPWFALTEGSLADRPIGYAEYLMLSPEEQGKYQHSVTEYSPIIEGDNPYTYVYRNEAGNRYRPYYETEY